ncbi:MAG: DUF6067 family protein [Candidatus Omnitrophica bacterium]|nr:DUF6067 family protein [Candidatus Omnitrophota bacterium]
MKSKWRLAAGGVIAAGLLFFYVRVVEPNRLTVTRLELTRGLLAQALDGRRLVHLADLHVDRLGFREQQLVRQVNALNPDWIVITGDLVNRAEGWPVALDLIEQLRALGGIWVVPGNTDNAALPAGTFSEGLAAAGARVLRNESAALEDTGVWLAGVDDPVEGRDRLSQAVSGIPTGAPVILLAHSPDIMPEAVKAGIPLVLAGHTHGGQIGIGWIRRFSDHANRGPYMSGRIQEGKTVLYISRGIGWKERPYRLMAPPEIGRLDFRLIPGAGEKGRFGSLSSAAGGSLILADFETESESRVRWRGRGAVLRRTNNFRTKGEFGAIATFKDRQSPKLILSDFLKFSAGLKDWSRFRLLAIDLYNPYSSQERLFVQIGDAAGRLYKEEVILPPSSPVTLAMRLQDASAHLDLRRIEELSLFRWRPGSEESFYLDAVRLEPRESEPAKVAVTSVKPPAAVQRSEDDNDEELSPPPVPKTRSETPIVPQPESEQPTDWRIGWAPAAMKVFREPERFTGKLGNPLLLSLAGGEAESVQLVLIGGEKGATIAMKTSDLAHELSGAVISRDRIGLSKVEYVRTSAPYYPVEFVGEWPDPLIKADRVEVPAGKVQPVWVTLTAPENAVPGRYRGTLTLTDQSGNRKNVDLRVWIWNFNLPDLPHLKTAFDFYRFRLEKAYREFVPNGSKWAGRMDELQEIYFREMLRYRISPVWGADPSAASFGEELEEYRRMGLTAFGVGRRGGNFGNNWPADSRELAEAVSWYGRAAAALRRLGAIDQAYVYVYDEPKPGDPQAAKVMEAIHRADPGLRNLLVMHEAPHPSKYRRWLKDADILCLRNTSVSTELVEEYKRQGKEVWIYASSPSHPYPTPVIDYPAMAARILPWICWKTGATGLLYWCVNFWEGDPARNPASFARDQNGNGFLFYPGEDGPVPSIRLEAIRDGIEDYEYLVRLQETLEAVKRKGRSNPAFENEAKTLLAIDPDLLESPRSYSKDPELLMKHRQEMAELIEKLQALLAGS